ncbi:hypothetical protein ACROYT_G005987 [Oculina patagonica]
MESANAEREEMANEETPRAAPDRDVLKQLLAEVAEIRKENKELKSKVANLTTKTRRQLFQKAKDSDPVCSNAVRNVCKELTKDREQQEDQDNQPKFDLSVRFNSPGNQAMASKVLREVRSVYGKEKWKKAVIKSAVHKYWRTLRDDKTRTTNNKLEDHRRKSKKNNRLKRKLSRRLSSLDKAVLSDKDKKKAREILSSPNAVDFMSSEESDNDEPAATNGPKPRKVRKLVWEKSKLTNLKERLDKAHLEGLSERQRRTSAQVKRTEEASARPCPTNGPGWAIRSD